MSRIAATFKALQAQGRKALEAIPFGQPILIGHHSERSDRKFRARATGKISKAFELAHQADHLEQRAEARNNGRPGRA